MEKIKISGINKKDSGLVIVKYVDESWTTGALKEATLNTKWQSQEVDYLEEKVGIGGEVEVEIVQKGQYTNITKVNFKSACKAVRGINTGSKPEVNQGAADVARILTETQQGVRSLNGQEQMPKEIEAGRPFNLSGVIPLAKKEEKFRTPAEMIATELVKAVIMQPGVPSNISHKEAVEMYKEVLELLG